MVLFSILLRSTYMYKITYTIDLGVLVKIKVYTLIIISYKLQSKTLNFCSIWLYRSFIRQVSSVID